MGQFDELQPVLRSFNQHNMNRKETNRNIKRFLTTHWTEIHSAVWVWSNSDWICGYIKVLTWFGGESLHVSKHRSPIVIQEIKWHLAVLMPTDCDKIQCTWHYPPKPEFLKVSKRGLCHQLDWWISHFQVDTLNTARDHLVQIWYQVKSYFSDCLNRTATSQTVK